MRQCDGGNRSNAAVLCGALDADLQHHRVQRYGAGLADMHRIRDCTPYCCAVAASITPGSPRSGYSWHGGGRATILVHNFLSPPAYLPVHNI